VGHFKRKFQGERDIATNLCWYQKTRVITLSCGIKISAVCSFVSSQSTRVSDRWMDGQTNGRTNGENCDPQDGTSIAASRGKNKTIKIIIMCLQTSLPMHHQPINIHSYLNTTVEIEQQFLPSSQNELASSWFQTVHFSPATGISIINQFHSWSYDFGWRWLCCNNIMSAVKNDKYVH